MNETAKVTEEILSHFHQLPAAVDGSPDVAREWVGLAFQCQQTWLTRSTSSNRKALVRAAQSDAPTAPYFRFWAADDLARSGDWDAALAEFGAVAESASQHERFLPRVDLARKALEAQATIYEAKGDHPRAIETREELMRSGQATEEDQEGMVLAGLLAENAGDKDRAAELYEGVAAREPAPAYTPPQLAYRARTRLGLSEPRTRSIAGATDAVLNAIGNKDMSGLDRLLSSTHFVVGVIGGHMRFETEGTRDRILAELVSLRLNASGTMLGTGDKRYMYVHESSGKLLKGPFLLIFMRSPAGWLLSGVALSAPPDELLERWAPRDIQTNQPLPFGLKAPWPFGDSFMAGGLEQFVLKSAAVTAADASTFGIGGALLAEAFSLAECGFGARGFYYNAISDTHQDEDAFAIDFTRYRRGLPFDNESGGTAVLAPAPGIIETVRDGRPSGNSTASNTVEIAHADPVTASADRYLSRYLHLAGPGRLPVQVGMPVIAGQRLGRMNDTGNSVLDHLHFSIHDQTVPSGNPSRGASVRPTPMEGKTLGDGNDGTCVRSTNLERHPAPPDDAEFVNQNVPSTLKPFETGQATITMRNTGPNPWSANYRLVSLATGWTTDSVTIGTTVADGDEVTVTIPVQALSSGDFAFQWRMSRPFGGLEQFGEPSQRVTIRVSRDGNGDVDCDDLDRQIAAVQALITILQQQLDTASPTHKGDIIDRIQQHQGEISALTAQKDRAGCP